MDQWLFLTAAALVCAAVSFTVAFTGVFKPMREAVGKLHPKLDELMHCPWCLNHYVVFLCLAIARNIPFIQASNNTFFNFVFTAFFMIGVGGLAHYVLLRAYEPVAKAEAFRKIKKT